MRYKYSKDVVFVKETNYYFPLNKEFIEALFFFN